MRYLLAIFGPEAENNEEMDVSPEEMQAMMQPWSDYGEAVVEAGVFLAGEGLQPAVTATTIKHVEGGERIVTDGPFAETKEQIGGFYLLDCANLDEALEWAKKVPMSEGRSVEVRPVMDYTQFGYAHPEATAEAAS